MKLDKLFNPKTIAIIGASDKKNSVGYALMNNILNSEYPGIVYPVNNKRDSVHATKAYDSIGEIGEKIDLAIIATPAQTVPDVVRDCGEAGVSGVVIISSGFQEAGKKGEQMSVEILALARKYDMRIIGPNCLGFIRPKLNLNASFANQMAIKGKIAFISQSGALCTAILDWSKKNNVGFSHFVSIGSQVDVGFHDLIDYFGADKETDSILIYMESITNAHEFMSAARAFSRSKPIIVLKSGRTEEGAKAAKSHTGSLAGNDAIFSAAFERAGIVRVETTVDLFHTAKALAMQPRIKGSRMCVITNAGGPGVIATDALVYSGGQIASLEKSTIEKLDKVMPKNWSKSNPVDILGDADPKRYKEALEICLDDDNIDSVLVILTPQAMSDPTNVAEALSRIKNPKKKMILASWMGGDSVLKGREILEKNNIPIYRQPEDAVRSFMNVYKHSLNIKNLYETPATTPHAFSPNIEANRIILKEAYEKGLSALSEADAKEFLSNYEIPVIPNAVAQTAKQASEMAEKIGFPVVMKILSADILHKTDVGGVKLNISSKEEAEKAYNKIMTSVRKFEPQAVIDGIFIEGMVKKTYELLIGSKKDSLFGPVIVFGMGGVAVEVFQDTSIALPPLNMSLSKQLIEKTKIYKLLKGYRNMLGVDVQSIQFLLYKFAYLLVDFPEIKELDINPFAVDENGGIVLDAKIVLDKSVLGKKIKPYSHMVISPYPKEYISNFTMKNGLKIRLRPIKPEDEAMEAEMFKNFSKETERHRFFKELGDVSHEMLTRYTQIDYDREIAIIAEIDEELDKKNNLKSTKRMIGVVRLIADPLNNTAEFAVVVADPWQFNGLGTKFTEYILKIAKKRGIQKISAKFLNDNIPMIKILEKNNFKIVSEKDTGKGELIF